MRKRLLLLILLFPVCCIGQMSSVELVFKPVPAPITRDTGVVKWNNTQPGYQNLCAEAKEFLYWVNYCRLNPQKFWDSVTIPVLKAFPVLKGPEAESLYKDLVGAGPLPMFSLNTTLTQTAQFHANDIARKTSDPSHNSTDGTNFDTRMKKAGIKRCAGENIAITSHNALLAVLLLYLDLGLPDKGHRKSLLDANLKETGIGGAPYGKDQFLLVQDLSCAQ